MSDSRSERKAEVRFGEWSGHMVNPDGTIRPLTEADRELLDLYALTLAEFEEVERTLRADRLVNDA